mmetsp:Transcript_63000/g.146708  ORF Transcript_63000/g.146708 Transcript_63000/m.146708 type:complete len:80 (+) Transcript_63000:2688-2927(+)
MQRNSKVWWHQYCLEAQKRSFPGMPLPVFVEGCEQHGRSDCGGTVACNGLASFFRVFGKQRLALVGFALLAVVDHTEVE